MEEEKWREQGGKIYSKTKERGGRGVTNYTSVALHESLTKRESLSMLE